jgi:N-glycosidase YbiA
MTIRFYRSRDAYGAFSNFSRHGFEIDGAYWPTVEHYFQAQKFPGTPLADQIRQARTAMDARNLGRTRSVPLREGWDEMKDDVMRRAIRLKFETHSELRELLLSTGEAEIVEDSPVDSYWGCGKDGSGRNMTGKILMEVRDALRNSETEGQP